MPWSASWPIFTRAWACKLVPDMPNTILQPALDDLEQYIVSEHYFTAGEAACRLKSVNIPEEGVIPSPLFQMTFCVLVLRGGTPVNGSSYHPDPGKFTPEEGRTYARAAALETLRDALKQAVLTAHA